MFLFFILGDEVKEKVLGIIFLWLLGEVLGSKDREKIISKKRIITWSVSSTKSTQL